MRDSYGAMRQAGTNSTNVNYLQAINDSKWLFHISQIIKASIRVATYLAQGDPVLVHCSDGWDRTSQICALSQLLLDPFYRTILGSSIMYM
jgi:protein tyrosine phosphatase